MRVYHNIPALYAYNSLSSTNSLLQKSIAKLSSGLRINSAADDAAGLAISEKMRAQISGLDKAVSNSQDGISMIQTAEGALNETHSILQRMRELSVQAANDTLTSQDRSYIQDEVNQLKDEIDRISTTTQFNKKQLLDGSAAALWSSDNLSTKAFIRGGLRQIDQFGQKNAAEGNYKISIIADPGQAEVQKTDIFKIKHENVIMNVTTNTKKGVESVRVDNLPAGTYNVNQVSAFTSTKISATQQFGTTAALTFGSVTGYTAGAGAASILLEVVAVNTATNTVTFRATSNLLYADGTTETKVDENLIVGTAAQGMFSLGLASGTVSTSNTIRIGVAGGDGATAYSVGDKIVISFYNTGAVSANVSIAISGTVNSTWDGNWDSSAGTTAATDLGTRHFALVASSIRGKDVHFKDFYMNTANGTVYQSDIVLEINTAMVTAVSAGYSLASFDAAYVGQVAQGDVKLRDLEKFWDANGKFMLEDPQVITLTQGDGKQTTITLNSTDTLNDVENKLNDAIAFSLGQAKYVDGNTDRFVDFIDKDEATDNTLESVDGTFVIRSLIAGSDGELNFAGDEDVIKALSLNVIQKSSESSYRVSIADAHSGNTVASNVKVTGNMLYGVVNPNVDVEFDSMANVKVEWSESAKTFRLKTDSDNIYETTLHLADNTTVFQIGANEGEDMGINIGNMSAEALGISNILVTDRESAARSITIIDSAIDSVSKQRSKLGAYQNRLEHTINNLTVASTNMTSAESRIRDVDMAKEMMNFTKLNILMQAGNSMLAQANQLPQAVLSLLR